MVTYFHKVIINVMAIYIYMFWHLIKYISCLKTLF